MKVIEELQAKVPQGIKTGVILILSLLGALVIIGYSIRLAVDWPASGPYLGIIDRTELKNTLDTAAGIITAVSSLGVMIVAVFGLQTLRLAKLDLRIRSQREAKTIAIAQCERYAKEIIPVVNAYQTVFAERNVPPFAFNGVQLDFKASDEALVGRAKEWVLKIPKEGQSQCISVLNMLETWAMNFNLRIADPEAAYLPASDVFCRTVVQLYPLIIMLRAVNNPDLFSNVQQLFVDWQRRKTGKVLEAQERALSAQLDNIRKMNKPSPPHPKTIGE